jgi:hypothetical protein
MINNFDKFILCFQALEHGEFYIVSIRKEKRLIKNYCIYNTEEFTDIHNEIIAICDTLNATAFVTINKFNNNDIKWNLGKSVNYALNPEHSFDANDIEFIIDDISYWKPKFTAIEVDHKVYNQYLDIIAKMTEERFYAVHDYGVNYIVVSKNFDTYNFSQELMIHKLPKHYELKSEVPLYRK